MTGKACTATAPRTKPLELSVLPEAGEAPFVNSLSAAKKSIRLMVYMLGQDGVFQTLKGRAAAGVDVRVILDGNNQRAFNQPAFDALVAAGVKVKWADPKFPFMHAKAFVVDDGTAMISTGNFPKGLLLDERNYVVRDIDRADVRALAALFDADWEGVDPNLSCTRLLVSPVNSKQRILDVITGAKNSLLVETLELADPDVLAAIQDRKSAGLDVRVVLADPAWNKTNQNAAAAGKLANVHIPVRWIPKSTMLIHVKSIIADGARAYLGSENLTSTSLEKNREVGLVVTDHPAVSTMTATFESDFGAARAF
jgi:phosphatidylserine/phosphatidylglycerophosphate/cardiolipin synthase-like enzyme